MNKTILKLSIPNIVSNITVPLLGMVDLALMGHLSNINYLGAISLGAMIFNLLYWGFGFLRMGTSGFTAQSYGKRDLSESIHILSRAMIVAIIGAIILLILQYPIQKIVFHFIKSEPDVKILAQKYFYIRIWAAPATIALYALNGWFIGMQNTRFPLYMAILVNVVNLLFNLLFVFVFHMNSSGVALGTVIAQYSGLLFGLILFRKYYGRLLKYFSYKLFKNAQAFSLFFKVNKDIFIRTLCLIFVFTFFTSASAATNKQILATNTILLQFFFIYSFFVDGFAYAAEALTGRFIGAGSTVKLKKVIKLLFYWGSGIAVVFTVTYFFAWKFIIKLMTDNDTIINLSEKYIMWIVLVPIFSFSSFLWDGIYIGATASKQMRNSMLISTLFVFFPLYFGLVNSFNNHALWIALLAFLLTRGIAQSFMAKKAVYQKD